MPQVIIDYEEYQMLLERNKKYLILERKCYDRIQKSTQKNSITLQFETKISIQKADVVEMIEEIFGIVPTIE